MEVRIIRGTPGTSEYEAAEELKAQLIQKYSDKNDTRFAWLLPSHNCNGKDVKDVDLLLFVDLRDSISFKASDGKHKNCFIQNFAVALEITNKDEYERRGSDVYVQYANKIGPSDKTGQNRRQAQRLNEQREFLSRAKNIRTPNVFFKNFLWLRSVETELEPELQWSTMNSNQGLVRLLELIANGGIIQDDPGELYASSWNISNKYANTDIRDTLANLYSLNSDYQKQYGSATRARIDKIIKKRVDDNEKYISQAIDGFLCMSGRPGTGKTVSLLLIAYELLCSELDVIFLTYNIALACDIKQMWWHLKSQKYVKGELIIRSQMSFFGSLWIHLDVNSELIPANSENTFFAKYDDVILPQLHEYILAMNDDDILQLKRKHEVFSVNKVLVDEGQDWHPFELEILDKLYTKERILVAQSKSQLVRSANYSDWHRWLGGSMSNNSLWPLRKSMRLKRELVRYCRCLGNSYQQDFPLSEGPKGGKISIMPTDLRSEEAKTMLNEAMQRHAKNRCTAYEFLTLVPDGYSVTSRIEGDQIPRFFDEYIDLSTHELRSTFEKSGDLFNQDKARFVNYKSSRGLEGWTVLCLSMDTFYDDLHGWFEDPKYFAQEGGQLSLSDAEETAEERLQKFLFNWLMIPLTRAIDHLIVHFDDPTSDLACRMKSSLDELNQ